MNNDLHARAVKVLSENEVRKMEHCVGFDRKKIYRRGGMAYFKPYRNYYDAGWQLSRDNIFTGKYEIALLSSVPTIIEAKGRETDEDQT